MSQSLVFANSRLQSFEGLYQAVKGTHVDVMQLGRGTLRGSLSHLGIGDFSLSIGAFDLGVRTQRVASDDKLIVGMLLSAADRVTHWSFDMRPADLLVIPPSVEHDGIFHGASSYAAIRFDPKELPELFGSEPQLGDPANWQEKNYFRANTLLGMMAAQRLPQIVSSLACQQGPLSDTTADFWKRTIIECVATNILTSLPPADPGYLPSAMKLVRKVEEYLEASGSRPVHISEICSTLALSRRSLHRAFQEVFGMGPVTFLRQKRLCSIYAILKASAPDQTTVSEVALQQGFSEYGRFAHSYRLLFGEYPSQTLSCAA